jgi:hypothetical protein
LSSSSGLAPSPVKSKASSNISSGNKKASQVRSKSSSNSSDPLQQLQRLLGPLMEPDLLFLFLRAVETCPCILYRRIIVSRLLSGWKSNRLSVASR